jgi:putative two-component system response regulator
MMDIQSVLIVDDNPVNIDVLSGILENDYRLQIATNGRRALELAQKKEAPDLILLDVMMPEMDGFEVCKRLKDDIRTKHIPVIFVTAKNTVIDEKQGFDLGGVDYITKPVSPPIVQARIKSQLAIYNQNRVLEEKVQKRTKELHETRLQIIQRLGRAAEFKDNETGMHVIRMSHYSRLIALAYGSSEKEAELLLNAAPMHDIGKIGIPDNVLLKPGKLNEEEWKIMKRHPYIGYQIIGNHPSELLKTAAEVALTHHEKWDGSGYPRKIKDEDIPLFGRIVAIADVFDALTSERPYKKKWPLEKAVDLIHSEKEKHFDPELVKAFEVSLDEIVKISERFSDKPEDFLTK